MLRGVGERGAGSKLKDDATRDQCWRSSRPLLASGWLPSGGLEGRWAGSLMEGGRRWLVQRCVLSRKTRPADALPAKLQVELISTEGGKGWGGYGAGQGGIVLYPRE